MPLTLNEAKEAFGTAYVSAIAANARANVATFRHDEESLDIFIRRSGTAGAWRSPQVNLQLKTTARPKFTEDGCLAYDLPVKNYEELRPTEYIEPYLLAVTVVPNDVDQWLDHNGHELMVRNCTYWLSLAGEPPTPNRKYKRVYLPLRQVFDVQQLTTILDIIQTGGRP